MSCAAVTARASSGTKVGIQVYINIYLIMALKVAALRCTLTTRCFFSWQGWPMYAQLLIDLFKYLAPFLRNVELTKPMQILYKVNVYR